MHFFFKNYEFLTLGNFRKLTKSRHFSLVTRTLGQRATWLWFLQEESILLIWNADE